MSFRLLSSVIIALILTISSAFAQKAKMSGNTLHAICNEPRLQIPPLCTGWTMGAIEGMRFGIELEIKANGEGFPPEAIANAVQSRLGFCIDEASTEEIVSRFSKFLKENPEQRKKLGRAVLHNVLRRDYPCS